MRRTLLILALFVCVAAPAGAQGLKLAFNHGLVSIDATAVPVRTILTEWGKLGGTNIVGAERIAGAPLTLKLVDVPEAQALDIVLRSVAGYMAAPRSRVAGASIYDRILILATSSGPAPAAARPSGPVNANPNAGTQRFIPQQQRPQRPPANNDANEDDEEDPNPPNAPVFTFPPPGQQGNPVGPGIFNPNGQPITVNPAAGGPQQITINPATPPTAPAYPTTPFGTGGTSTPGVILAPPPQPGQPVRPPG